MSIEAERAVLGSLLLDHNLMDDCYLSPIDFDEYEGNQTIFRVFQSAKEYFTDTPNPLDLRLVATKWGKLLEEVGGISRLSDLQRSVPSTALFQHYQKAVRRARVQRELAELGRQIAIVGGGDFAELKARIEELEEMQRGDGEGGPVHMVSLLEGHERVIAKRANSVGGITGAHTACDDITNLSKGHQEGDLEIIGARPSMGKTTYAMNDMNKVTESGWGDVFFSLEMGAMDIVEQMASCIGGIYRDRIASGQMSDNDWDSYYKAIEIISNRLLFIDDKIGATVEYIRRQVKTIKKKFPNKRWVIHIDFLQFIQSEKEFSNTKERIGYILKYLKRMAKELWVKVVCLSAVGRDCEKRPDKRPLLSDLRDSGDIESDADIVTFIYRDDYYYPDSPKKNIAELIVAKGRKIGTGTFDMFFVPQISRFLNPDKKQKEQIAEKVKEHEQRPKNSRR